MTNKFKDKKKLEILKKNYDYVDEKNMKGYNLQKGESLEEGKKRWGIN